MVKEAEGQTLKEYASRKKRYRRNRAIILVSLLVLAAIIGVIYLVKLINRTFQNYEVMETIENTEENLAGYLEYNGAFLRYSQDGVVAVDKSGSLLWNGSYEMMDPVADTCGKYAVIADRGNKILNIFNEKGIVRSIKTEYDIIKAEIAGQGVTAVLMEDKENSYIKLYSKEADDLGEIIVNKSKDGYPMDISLSEDGEKVAAVYLSVNKGKMESYVVFRNFGEVGQNLTDRFAGGWIFYDNVIPRVTFLNNNVACAYKENGLYLFDMEEIAELVKEETVEGKIKSVVHSSKYTGLVLEGEDSSSSRLLLYDLAGNKVLEKELTFDYKNLYLSDEEIILYDNLSCLIYKTNGKEKFRYTFTTNISAFYPINHLDRYFMVNPKEILEIQLLE